MKRVWLNILVQITLASCPVLLAACSDSPQKLVQSAKDYLAKGDWSAAVIQLRNALQKTPDDAEARYLLGSALIERRDPEGAIKELRRALKLGYPPDQAVPALARALVADGDARELIGEFGNARLPTPDAQAALKSTLGNALLSLGKPQDAEAAFNAALAAKADYPEALLGVAMLRAASGDLEAAQKTVDAVLAQPNPPPEASLFKSQLLVAEGHPDAARAVLDKVVEAKPGYLAAHYELTSLLISKGDLDQASAQVSAIRKVSPQDARAYFFEALIASRHGDLPAARAAIQQVLKRNPVHVPSLLLAGEIEFRAQQFNQAENYLRQALKGAPNSLYGQRLLAATYVRLGSPARALEVLQPALSRGTHDPKLMAVAGEAYLAVGDFPKAAQYFADTTVADPKNAAARTRLGQVRFAEGDTEGAVRDLEAASAMDPNVSQADLALISNLLRQKKFDEALAAVGRLEQKQSNSALVANLKGLVYLSKNDPVAARANFEHALQIQPEFVPAVNNLAQLDRLENKPDAARQRYQALLDKQPNNEQALLGYSRMVQALGGESSEVEALIKRAVKANPQSIMSRVELVSFYSRRGDADKALLAAQEANAALPNDPRTLELLGRVQLGAGDATLAVGTFTQMVAAEPGAVEPLMRLAGALVALKEYDKAIEKLREALKLNPDLSEANREIVAIYVMSDRPDQALAEIKAIQKRAPNDMRGYVFEGDFWGQQKKWREAEAAFRSAQKLAPDDATVALRIYAAMANGGKPTAADLAEDKWLQEHPKDVIVPGYLAEQALRKQDYKSAARQYQELVARQPDNVLFLNNLAWVAGELGDPKALSYAEKAATLAPGNPSVLDTLGTLLVKQGKVTQGLEKLQKAVQLAPSQSDIRLHLAEALIKSGDKAGARKELETLAQASAQPVAKAAPDNKGSGAPDNKGSGAPDSKGSGAQKSAPAATAKAPQLTCNPGCAAEVAALLKTL